MTIESLTPKCENCGKFLKRGEDYRIKGVLVSCKDCIDKVQKKAENLPQYKFDLNELR